VDRKAAGEADRHVRGLMAQQQALAQGLERATGTQTAHKTEAEQAARAQHAQQEKAQQELDKLRGDLRAAAAQLTRQASDHNAKVAKLEVRLDQSEGEIRQDAARLVKLEAAASQNTADALRREGELKRLAEDMERRLRNTEQSMHVHDMRVGEAAVLAEAAKAMTTSLAQSTKQLQLLWIRQQYQQHQFSTGSGSGPSPNNPLTYGSPHRSLSYGQPHRGMTIGSPVDSARLSLSDSAASTPTMQPRTAAANRCNPLSRHRCRRWRVPRMYCWLL
jgi:hypothetical protein